MTTWHASVQASFEGFSLDIAIEGGPGPIAIIGPNGSGKTTFLRFLAGAVKPELAEFVLGGTSLVDTKRGLCVPMEKRQVGYLPQGYSLFSHLTVLGNVAFGLSGTLADRRTKASHMLDDLGCSSLALRSITGLSGGEQQRVALARSLVVEPELLLLDEPLSALDASSRRSVREFLSQRLDLFGKPSIMTTHDVRDVAALGAQVYVMERGRLIQSGSLSHLVREPASEFVAEFVSPTTIL